jgi:hypothetical protein
VLIERFEIATYLADLLLSAAFAAMHKQVGSGAEQGHFALLYVLQGDIDGCRTLAAE